MHHLLSALLPALLLGSLAAQQPPSQQPPPPPPSPIYTVPQALSGLADQPATHTGVTFDRNLLAGAQGLLGGDARAAALSSITVDSYHYPRPAFYNPDGMHAILATYDAAGWRHLVNANASPGRSAQPNSAITDLWLHFAGPDIDNLAVLIRAPRDMNLIQVAGDLRPLDLLHLSGHFGIPHVDPDAVMVPAPPGH